MLSREVNMVINLEKMVTDTPGKQIMRILATFMTLGAFFSLLLAIFLRNSYAETAFWGFLLAAIFHWGFYFIHFRFFTSYKFSDHLCAFFSLVLFFFIAIYNPLHYSEMWIFLLFYPISVGILGNIQVFKIWVLSFLLLYNGFIFIDPTVTTLAVDDDFLPIISRVLYALGSSVIGLLLIFQGIQIEKKLKDKHRTEKISHIVRVLYAFIPIVERKTQSTRKEIDEMSRMIRRVAGILQTRNVHDWEIELISLLHYVSRIKCPDYMFEKKGRLSSFEFDVIQEHCFIGNELLADSKEFETVKEALMHHHERVDGSGYPNQLKSQEIPVMAQILGIVDCYIAMTKTRSYRSSLTSEEARTELISLAGNQFSVEIVQAFLEATEAKDEDYKETTLAIS